MLRYTALLCVWGLIVGSFVEARGTWRIVDGKSARRGQFPFIASIGMCTASILNENTILTAAHCVCKGGEYLITVGIINDEEEVENRQDFMVKDIILHPGYKHCGRVDPMDIAVLKLAGNIKYNSDVQPIKLHCGSVDKGQSIISMGFGQDNKYKSGILRYGYNTAHYDCQKGFICSHRQPNYIYFGDSGGPMVTVVNDKMVQAGVNSGIGLVSLYSNVPQACAWIKSKM